MEVRLRYDGAAHRRVDRLGGAGQDRIVSRKQMFKTPANVCTPAANVQNLLKHSNSPASPALLLQCQETRLCFPLLVAMGRDMPMTLPHHHGAGEGEEGVAGEGGGSLLIPPL